MGLLQEKHYKEAEPLETVFQLRRILHDLGIHVIEEWNSRDGDACHALRIRILGSDIGTNGKGITREYALASAYAEFMERMQNSILASPLKFDIHMKAEREFVDERTLTASEVISAGGRFIRYFLEHMHFCMDDDDIAAMQLGMSYKGQEKNGHYFCRPFYSLKQKEVCYLPREVYYPFYGSNGMCAGNGRAEALVQGISEILERYVQKKIIYEKISLPDIPMKYLQKFPETYQTYQNLLEKKPAGYEYLLKDASLGGRYPVAAFIAVNQNTGSYGVRFGAHPDYGIAIERTLTEAFQGRDLEKFTVGSILDFTNETVDDDINVYNSFKAGIAQYPVELLFVDEQYEFTPVQDVSGMSNDEILNAMLEKLLREGWDVLIRNVSYLGFHSYHVIIPGMSEILPITHRTSRVVNTIAKAVSVLRNLGGASPEELDLVRKYEDYVKYSHYDNMLKSQFGVPLSYLFPGDQFSFGGLYLSAMICYQRGQYEEALKRMREFNRLNLPVGIDRPWYYRAIETYIAGKSKGYPSEKIDFIIGLFFDKKTCEEVCGLLKSPENVLRLQYPKVIPYECEKCEMRDGCHYDIALQVHTALWERQKEYFPEQMELKDLFEGVTI